MADPLATADDVEDRGHLVADAASKAKLEHLLRLGSALLRLRFETLDARIAAGTLDAELVVDVLVAMVVRAPSVANPGGIRSESVSGDTYSVTYEGVKDSGGRLELWVTGPEVSLLAPVDECRPLFGSARLRAMLS